MDHILTFVDRVVTGGAWGTELQTRGLPIGASADSWNVTRPREIEELARAYAEAGSHIVLTNTFQANRLSLARHGLASDVGRINRLGATLARRGADYRAYVFGAIGPAPDASDAAQYDAYREQAESLAEGNVHGFVVETFTSVEAARSAVRATVGTGLPVAATVTPISPGMLDDESLIVSALVALQEEGASAVGLNCIDVGQMVPLCEMLAGTLDAPLWMKPNAGTPIVFDGAPRYGLSPDRFADHGAAFIRAGARYVGGCCGVGPAHIAALVSRLQSGVEL